MDAFIAETTDLLRRTPELLRTLLIGLSGQAGPIRPTLPTAGALATWSAT